MKPTLLVLAAGMGSRYGSLKQVDGLGPSGETIIDYSIHDAIEAGFGKVVMIIRKSIEAEFKEVFLKKYAGKIDFEYVLQEIEYVPEGMTYNPERVKPWGTAHAVLMAADVIKEPFAVINGDDFYGKDAFVKMAEYLKDLPVDSTKYSIVGYCLANTLSEYGSVSRGVCKTDSEHYLTDIDERTSIQRIDGKVFYKEGDQSFEVPDNAVVSMNFWGFTPKFFEQARTEFVQFLKERGQELKSEFFIPLVADKMIKSKEASVYVLETSAKWFGVTYKEDRPFVVEKFRKLAEDGTYPTPLFK